MVRSSAVVAGSRRSVVMTASFPRGSEPATSFQRPGRGRGRCPLRRTAPPPATLAGRWPPRQPYASGRTRQATARGEHPVKVGCIGLGDIAQKAYLPVLAGLPGIELQLHTRTPATLD